MASQQWTIADFAKTYGTIVAKKAGFIAIGWAVIYFLSQPMRYVPPDGGINIWPLFGLLLGALAGFISGWYIATDSVEDSGINGIVLWIILVLGCVIPMLVVEGMMHILTKWPVNFGGFMVLTAAILMALASAVWNSSAQG